MRASLIERVTQLLGPVIAVHDLATTLVDLGSNHDDAHVRLESSDLVVDVIRDRGQEWIEVGSKSRPGPRKPLRRWPLGHVVAFLDGASDPHGITDLETEAGWLTERSHEILTPAVLNSLDLNHWAVRSSRRRFGQGHRG